MVGDGRATRPRATTPPSATALVSVEPSASPATIQPAPTATDTTGARPKRVRCIRRADVVRVTKPSLVPAAATPSEAARQSTGAGDVNEAGWLANEGWRTTRPRDDPPPLGRVRRPGGGRSAPSPTSCSSRMRISEPVLTSCIPTAPSRDAVTARPPERLTTRAHGRRLPFAASAGGPEPLARTASRNARRHAVAAARSSSGGVGVGVEVEVGVGVAARAARRRLGVRLPRRMHDEEFTPKWGEEATRRQRCTRRWR